MDSAIAITRTPAGVLVAGHSESEVARIAVARPRSLLGLTIWKALPYLDKDLAYELVDRLASVTIIESELRATAIRNLGAVLSGLVPREELRIEDYGIVSRKVVTDTAVAYIVDAFQNTTELENFKNHGLGTGGTAEAASQTALVTELTTEYTANVRAVGTTTESAANIYQTVATNTLDSGTPAITEHAVFSAATVGTMLDRSLFSAINLVGANGDGLQTDYRLTFTAGG